MPSGSRDVSVTGGEIVLSKLACISGCRTEKLIYDMLGGTKRAYRVVDYSSHLNVVPPRKYNRFLEHDLIQKNQRARKKRRNSQKLDAR